MDSQDSVEKLLGSLDKSQTDQVRVRETMFKGKEYIDIRIFSVNQSGEYIPTKKGVTLSREKMKELIQLLNSLSI